MKKKYLATLIAATIFSGASTGVMAAAKEQGSSNGQPFQTLQAKIDVVQMNLDDAVALLQGQIDDLVADQADQDAVIAAIQASIAALEARVSANETDIAAIQALDAMQTQLIDALTVRLAALEVRVSDNENDIAALVNANQVLQGLISAINSQISIINTRITSNDGDISYLQGRVIALQNQATSLQNQMYTKQARVTGYCAAGSSIRQIHANGNVTCEADNVSAGVGTLQTYSSYGEKTIPGSFILVQYVSDERYCDPGYRAVGGGYRTSGSLGVGHTYISRPYGTMGWQAGVRSDSVLTSRTLYTYVTCARVQ